MACCLKHYCAFFVHIDADLHEVFDRLMSYMYFIPPPYQCRPIHYMYSLSAVINGTTVTVFIRQIDTVHDLVLHFFFTVGSSDIACAHVTVVKKVSVKNLILHTSYMLLPHI